jgi:hypothetical protein
LSKRGAIDKSDFEREALGRVNAAAQCSASNAEKISTTFESMISLQYDGDILNPYGNTDRLGDKQKTNLLFCWKMW